MNTQQNNSFRLGATLVAGVLSGFLPVLFDFVVSFIYGFIVGFQSRGDMNIIIPRVSAMLLSPIFLLVLFVVCALVSFWRGRALSQRVSNPVLHAVVIAAVALAVIAGAYLALRGDGVLSAKNLIEGVIVLACSYLGLSFGAAAPEAAAEPLPSHQ